MKISYMTLCYRENTEVTYMLNKQWRIEVTFEKAVTGGFNTAVFNDRGELLSNEGFNPSDIDYFSRFTKQCIQEMYDEIQEGLVDA